MKINQLFEARETLKCPKCSGSGVYHYKICPICGGTTTIVKNVDRGKALEARVPGLDYTDKAVSKKDPTIDRVILALKSKDSEIMTKMAFKYKKLDNLEKAIKQQRDSMNTVVKEKMGELFDAQDVWSTRVIDTVSATMTLAKRSKGTEASVQVKIDYEKVALEIMALLEGELLEKGKSILSTYTDIQRFPASEPKSPALTVKAKNPDDIATEESINETMFYVRKPDGQILSYISRKKAEQVASLHNSKVETSITDKDKKKLKFKESINEASYMDKFKAWSHKFLNAFKSWGMSYDQKLDAIKDQMSPFQESANEPVGYAKRVKELEDEGMTTSDAQGVADAEIKMKKKKVNEDFGSSDWSAVIKYMDEVMDVDPIHHLGPKEIVQAAKLTAEHFHDMIGHETMEATTAACVKMYLIRKGYYDLFKQSGMIKEETQLDLFNKPEIQKPKSTFTRGSIMSTQTKINTKNPMKNPYIAGWQDGVHTYMLVSIKGKEVVISGSGTGYADVNGTFTAYGAQSMRMIGTARVIASVTDPKELPAGSYTLYVFK